MSLARRALAAGVSFSLATSLVLPANANIVASPITHSAPGAKLQLKPVGTHETDTFEQSAAEIVSYHAASKRLLVVNALSGKITVLDVADPSTPKELHAVSGGEGTTINSVAVRADGLAVAAVEPANKTDKGEVIFFDAAGNGTILGRVSVGSLPDMVTITEDGKYALVANEGEPAEDYSVDPDGSVSVIDLPAGVSAPTSARTATFDAFEGTLPEGVRVFGPQGTDVQNLEPEYISTRDGKAYVTLQENNAVAVVDIATATVEKIMPLGYVDFAKVALDPSDEDGKTELRNGPVKGMLLPDGIATYTAAGQTYFVTANEGDSRDWAGYSEEKRITKLQLSEGFAGMTPEEIAAFQAEDSFGRMKVTTSMGKNATTDTYDELYAFGGRGFSIFTADGQRVFNSDEQFEQILSQIPGEIFNPDHTANDADDRSDDKGPEPEGVTLGKIGDHTFAFIGLERTSGIMVYDVTNPIAPEFVTFFNNRDFAADPAAGNAGDLGPEGLTFIPAAGSPNGKPMLAVGNEVSGSTTLYEIEADPTLTTTPTPAPNPGSSIGSSGSKALGFFGGILAVLAVFFGMLPHLPGLQAQLMNLQSMLMGRR